MRVSGQLQSHAELRGVSCVARLMVEQDDRGAFGGAFEDGGQVADGISGAARAEEEEEDVDDEILALPLLRLVLTMRTIRYAMVATAEGCNASISNRAKSSVLNVRIRRMPCTLIRATSRASCTFAPLTA